MECLPRVLYQNLEFVPRDKWEGFLKNGILVKVRCARQGAWRLLNKINQAYKCIYSGMGGIVESVSISTLAYVVILVMPWA